MASGQRFDDNGRHRSARRRDSVGCPGASSIRGFGSPRAGSRYRGALGVNLPALASSTGRHQLGHVVRIDHEFFGRSVIEDLICLDCPF